MLPILDGYIWQSPCKTHGFVYCWHYTFGKLMGTTCYIFELELANFGLKRVTFGKILGPILGRLFGKATVIPACCVEWSVSRGVDFLQAQPLIFEDAEKGAQHTLAALPERARMARK